MTEIRKMKLYIDESGNTGEASSQDGDFNFAEQPYYVLAGLLMDDAAKAALEKFVLQLKTKYHIQGNELKAKAIYKTKSNFLKDLVDYLASKRIPVFIELMDKIYYIHIHFVDYFIVPYYSLPLNDSIMKKKREIAAGLGKVLSQDIYDSFFAAIKSSTNESLENFYDELISHFDAISQLDFKKNVEGTKADYFKLKEKDPQFALEKFLPIPDENPNSRLLNVLPNYSAFTNLIARTQKYINDYTTEDSFYLVHDEQKQFDIIFKKALELMKVTDSDSIVENTVVAEKGTFNVFDNVSLDFVDSKTDVTVQAADMIAGMIMRFWSDFKNGNEQYIEKYMPLAIKLNAPLAGSSLGINYMVPFFEHLRITERMINTVSIKPFVAMPRRQ